MLHQAESLSDLVAGTQHQWQHPFAHPRPRDFVRAASVWFTGYPRSIITERGKNVVEALGSDELLVLFEEIGIEAIHTGPMKRAGGIVGRKYTPSIDGFFDRIELTVEPEYGTDDQYIEMASNAKRHGVIIIGDLVPAHTGKGADFRLAERNYKSYDGLYVMVDIPPEDWHLLPAVRPGDDTINLSLETVRLLEVRRYIPGPLEVIPFYDPGVKDTNWAATDVVTGVDGIARRWVYLHVFKEGQPSFNWLDPTFGAQRIVLADVTQSLFLFGAKALRLDANALLGVEGRPGVDQSWVEGHPLARSGSDTIAMMIRKLGGFSFQELNLSIEDVKRFADWGPDLTYDFITRPAYLCALATGDAGPLRLSLELMLEHGLDSGSFVHALQNHDELMFDFNHLRKHANERFTVNGEQQTGRAIYDGMYERAKEVVLPNSRLIKEFSNLGFCATIAAYAAAALGIEDPYHMTGEQKARVQRLHLLAAAFNAMQPGVFAISGWDLVGALLVPEENLGSWLEDQDYRWMNRGAFDLVGWNPRVERSEGGLPKAAAIYGSLNEQLDDPESFASQLRRMLRVRRDYEISSSRLVSAPQTEVDTVLAMVLERPEERTWTVTLMNFGQEPAAGTFIAPQLASRSAHMVYSTVGTIGESTLISESGTFSFDLAVLEAEVFTVGQDDDKLAAGESR